MIEQYLHLFDIKGNVHKWLPVTNGYINTSTILKCTMKDNTEISYFVQKVNTSIFQNPDQIGSNIQYANNFLQQNGYLYTPLELVLTKKQEKGIWIKDEYWRIFKGIENAYTPSKIESVEQAYQAAKAFSHFSKCLNRSDTSQIIASIPDFHDFGKRVTALQKAVKTDVANRVQICKTEIDWIETQLHKIRQFQKLIIPKRFVHGDPKIGNLLFLKKNKKVIAVVDWDTVMQSSLLIEYGDMIRSMGSTADENETDLTKVYLNTEYIKAIKRGFLEEWESQLTDNERNNLDLASHVIILIQAIRFLTDFLTNDIYYATNHEMHNWVRTKNQVKLLLGYM